jgi:hypothetical protein
MKALFVAIGLVSIAVTVSAQVAKEPSWEQRSWLPLSESDHGSLMLISDEPCCETVSRVPLEPSSDFEAIEAHRDRAFRLGPVLQLKLSGDRSLRIIDRRPRNPEQYNCLLDYDGACRYHSLIAWWDEQRYYVVQVSLHEDSATYLISELDGRTTRVAAPPVRSPSGHYAIAYSTNVMTGGELDLVDMSTKPPRVLEITTGPTCEGAQSSGWLHPKPVWIDDSHVKFDNVEGISLPMDNPNSKQLMRIADGKVEWEC